jgi:hypothetical protein
MRASLADGFAVAVPGLIPRMAAASRPSPARLTQVDVPVAS